MAVNVGAINSSLEMDLTKFSADVNRAIKMIAGMGAQFNKALSPRGANTTTVVNATRKAGKAIVSSNKATGNSVRRINKKTQEEARGQIDKTVNHQRRAFKDITRIVSGIIISQGFYRVARAIREASNALGTFIVESEKTSVAFRVLLGDAKEAAGFLSAVEQFAAVTPFQIENARRMAQRLKAMGFEAINIIPIMSTLADATAAAGGDPEVLERVGLALGKIKTQGRLSQRQLLSMAQAGIPVYEILREELQLTADEMANIGNLKISADAAIPALLRGMQKRYEGAAQAVSRTWAGLTSTIVDNLLLIGRKILETPFDKLKGRLEGVTDRLIAIQKVTKEFGVGGLFEALVAPDLRVGMKILIKSLAEIGKRIGEIVRSFAPFVNTTARYLLDYFILLLPIIHGVLVVFREFVYWVSNATGSVKGLSAALAGLTIGVVVSVVIAGLARAIKTLLFAGVAAKAIINLALSIRVLGLMLFKNPILAGITLAAIGLGVLAARTESAKSAMDEFRDVFARTFGIDKTGFLDAKKTADDLALMDKYLEGEDLATEKADNLRESLDKAKKASRSLLQSFDEVYTIPEESDSEAEDFSEIFELIPAFNDVDDTLNDISNSMGDISGGMIDILSSMQKFKLSTIWDVASDAWAILKREMVTILKEMSVIVIDWGISVGETIGPAISEGLQYLKTNVPIWGAWLLEAFLDAWRWLLGNADEAGRLVGNWFVEVIGKIPELLLDIFKKLPTIITFIMSIFEGLVTILGRSIVELIKLAGTFISGFIDGLLNGKGSLWDALKEVFKFVFDLLSILFIEIIPVIVSGLWKILKASLSALGEALWELIKIIWDTVQKITDAKWRGILDFLGETFDLLVTISKNIISGIIPIMKSIWEDVKRGVIFAWTDIKEKILSIIKEIKSSIHDVFKKIASSIEAVWDNIKEAASTAWNNMKDVILGIVEGLKNGIESVFNKIKDIVNNITNSVRDAVNAAKRLVGIDVGSSSVPDNNTRRTTTNTNRTLNIPGFAQGTVSKKEQLAVISEGNKHEAIIPLETGAMDPFADAVAQRLSADGGGGSPQQILMVGTLIADDKGIKKLARRMQIINLQEDDRRN